jgi:RNA polymerase sigma factor (sigma-70 family)
VTNPEGQADGAEVERGRRLRDLDAQAWQDLVAEHDPGIRRRLLRTLARGDDAEDAVGEVWLRLLQGIARYDERLALGAYLAGICDRVCSERRRSRLRWRRWWGSWAPHGTAGPPPSGPGDSLDREGARQVIETALRALPAREAQVARLRYFCERSPPEIAGLLGIEVCSVRHEMSRALRHLRTGGHGADLREWVVGRAGGERP